MPQQPTARFSRPLTRVATLALVAIALLAVATPTQGATSSKRVVKQAQNATLGKTVLTTLAGRTLYTLSAETGGTFICKRGCLAVWHPLYVGAGVKPTGPVKLGAIKRPDNGRRQVTFRGRPLYTFDGDEGRGDANGEGIRDVGTWHAASP
jgi:predicted lipoprotein with Yx(FWY)xxD motif